MKHNIMPPVEMRKSGRRPILSTKKPSACQYRIFTAGFRSALTHSDGDDAVPDVENAVDDKLGIRVFDTNTIKHTGDIIRHETVSRPLREQTSGDQDEKPVAVALGFEKLQPASLISLLLESDGLFDFLKLKFHKLVLDVAFSVDFCEHIQGLLVLALGDVPTWRLGD
jgi:hypothetical protein